MATIDSAPTVLASAEQVRAKVGQVLGHSDWLLIEQDRIDEFARATGDVQWIHVDRERAKQGPFGATIAHGWLTASLLPLLLQQIYRVEARMAINYGVDRIRFTSPVTVGSRVRAVATLVAAEEKGPALQLKVSTVIEIEGSDKPALVAETLGRYFL
jgi:acyl dehydratase